MVKQKAFFANPSLNIMYPNEENIIIVPTTKRMDIITSIKVYLILGMSINYKKNDGKKAFLANLKHQYCVSQCG